MKKFHTTLVLLLLLSSSQIFSQDEVTFNYQGRVKVQGNPFTGSGQFKFAIVNNPGTVSLWSNDNSSTIGDEPLASITIPVSEGIFNVLIGDTDLGMAAINRSIFNHPNQIKLRIWFSDGTHGFQQLIPDHELTNIELLGMASGSTDFTIYVNGTTGNDEHNGLSPGKAKKTIQAAVDVLPERLKCSVVIDIADGVYRETVKVFAISVEYPNTLVLQGDEAWTPSSGGDPTVRITGNDDDISATKVRDYAVFANNTAYAYFKGIKFDNGKKSSILITDGGLSFNNCKFTDAADYGLYLANNSVSTIVDCIAENNGSTGILIYNSSYANIQNCVFRYNGYSGLRLHQHSTAYFPSSTTSDFHHNAIGIIVNALSRVSFASGYSGQIHDNTTYGIMISYFSHTEAYTLNTFSNNGGGAADNVNVSYGGAAY